jgi:oxygen-independent coproporphyrinogen-3 oxidase
MYYESENLSKNDKYNEYVMIGLRTMWGVSTDYLNDNFGINYKNHFIEKCKKFIDSKHLKIENSSIITTDTGRFLSDGISSELFIVNLKN